MLRRRRCARAMVVRRKTMRGRSRSSNRRSLAGALAVGSAQIPFNIRDGRLRVGATTSTPLACAPPFPAAMNPVDQADIRAALALTMVGPATGAPKFSCLRSDPRGVNRSVDVTGLSSWLAVRTIDHETRRLDAIERGEPPPPARAPISPPPQALAPLAPEVGYTERAAAASTGPRPRSAPAAGSEAKGRHTAAPRRRQSRRRQRPRQIRRL